MNNAPTEPGYYWCRYERVDLVTKEVIMQAWDMVFICYTDWRQKKQWVIRWGACGSEPLLPYLERMTNNNLKVEFQGPLSPAKEASEAEPIPTTEEPPTRPGALKYFVTPECGDPFSFPTYPEGLTAEELGPHIRDRLIAMERQGYWRNDSMQRIPLQNVTYTIRVEEPAYENETSEEG